MRQTQKDIVREALEHNETLTAVSVYDKYNIVALAPIITKLRKDLIKEKSPLKICTKLNDKPNEDGIIVPFKYYFMSNCKESPVVWPRKTTNFERGEHETKKDAILRFMNMYGSINTLQGYTEIYSYRIGALIHVLRKEGYDIITKMVHYNDRKHPTAEYVLEGWSEK